MAEDYQLQGCLQTEMKRRGGGEITIEAHLRKDGCLGRSMPEWIYNLLI